MSATGFWSVGLPVKDLTLQTRTLCFSKIDALRVQSGCRAAPVPQAASSHVSFEADFNAPYEHADILRVLGEACRQAQLLTSTDWGSRCKHDQSWVSALLSA
eukprot:406396-Pelagomonas_calceolata.AAC.1